MTPLYEHTSEETAYLVSDYPYGRLRCQIKFWLEMHPKKGYRFCSRTCNPKNGRWNASKCSTYSRLAGCMYLDEKNHCVWNGLSEYSNSEAILKFVQQFPGADYSILREHIRLAIPMMKARAEGKLRLNFSINGEKQERTPEDLQHEQDEAKKNLALLQQVNVLFPWRGVVP